MNKFKVAIGAVSSCLIGSMVMTSPGHPNAERQGSTASRTNTVLLSNTARARVTASEQTTLAAGMSLTSSNGDYQLLMTNDGDLVEISVYGISPIDHTYGDTTGNFYIAGGNSSADSNWSVTGTYVGEHATQIWHTGTGGNPGARAVLQDDGNLVVYSASNAVLWASNTAGNPDATLSVQYDGNIVIYANGQPLWATKAVSTIDGHGSDTVNFRNCPGVIGDDCGVIESLPSGSDITMLCWEDVTPIGWTPPTNRWFYALVDGTQDGLGYINAAFVDNQIKTPKCNGSTPSQDNPSQSKSQPQAQSTSASTPSIGFFGDGF